MKKSLSLLLSLILILVLAGCGNDIFNFDDYEYPDYPRASSDDTIDSWDQWDKNDGVIDIDWFIDNSNYYLPREDSLVVQRILEKTGIRVHFRKATTNDGTELSTMIAGNDLPDILSLTSGMFELIDNGTIFPITGLAERWAPSLLRRLKSNTEYYNSSMRADGEIYYLKNNYYAQVDIDDYAKMGGYLVPNQSIIVRKDYLKAYIEHKKSEDPTWEDKDMANPDGIYDFLVWTKREYNLTNSNHSVLMTAFSNDSTYGSTGIKVLMEYFNCSEEDANGNYVYPQSTERFKEVMLFLNKLYKAGLLTDGCLGATQSQINTYIQNGEPIMYMGSIITPSSNLRNWEKSNPQGQDAAYVPIVFTNKDGEMPQVGFDSSGELHNMITKNCERPDRVIKLLDYLYSEEGQRLIYYGLSKEEDPDNETFVYTIEPGTTVTLDNGTEYTYKYGQIKYTDEVYEALLVGTHQKYGIYFCMFMCDQLYMLRTSIYGGQFNNYRDYVKWNSRSALIPYSYNKRGFSFELDSKDSRYKTALNARSNMIAKWYKKYSSIIAASSEASVIKQINDILAWCESSEHLSEYVAFMNDCFQAHKQRLGITYAYPPNDPTSSYHSLTITTIYGDTSFYKPIPEELLDRN